MLSRPTPEPPAPAPPAEAAPSGRLATFYGEPLALVLQLQASAEFGAADVLRERTLRLLRQAERDAQDAGYSRDDTRDASFAIVAFLDETIQSSAWSEREQWLAQPLQMELYDRNDAGEEVFTRIDALRSAGVERVDVLEVYYLCLALGFRGRYEFLPAGEHRALIREIYDDLSKAPVLAPGPLAPHAEPIGRVAATVRRRVPAWAVLAACAALGVIVYASLAVYARTNAGSAIRDIERVTEAAMENGPPAAPFGAPPADLLSDSTATDDGSAPEAAPDPIDGFPPSDALPADPEPEPDASGEADAPEASADDPL